MLASVAQTDSGSVEAVAALIMGDLASSQDLQLQRERTGLGSLLKEPLPISRLDADPVGKPALAAELLPYVGSYAAYETALKSTTPTRHSSGMW